LKQDEQALALVTVGDAATPAQLHIAAQVSFRRGDFDKAIEIYEQLLARAQPGDDLMELQTNLLAAYSSAGRSRELTDRDIPVSDPFPSQTERILLTASSLSRTDRRLV
jgi:hypothetical protein